MRKPYRRHLLLMALLMLTLMAALARSGRGGAQTASSTIGISAEQCARRDINHDNVVDVTDGQMISFHYGQVWGMLLYDRLYDVEPELMPDWDIDIKDLQKVFGAEGTTCLLPTIWEALGGSYANAWPCAGGTGDPIGTVFLMASVNASSASQLADDRLFEIGMGSGYGSVPPWVPSFTDRDNFLDNGGCVEGAITRGTNKGWHTDLFCLPYCVDSRWHVRCIVHAQPSPYSYWASCTPHWDSAPPPPPCPLCPPPCDKHYVPRVYNGTENYGGSGYDAARDWLWYQLIYVRSIATDVGPVFFDNKALRSQCDNTIFSQTVDGKVNVILLQ